jgi:acyl-CoA synthetase (AMP-forming)/AMP-acid ligase II
MPLYHSSAAILSFLAVLQSGSTQALGRKFSSRNFWREVRESEATMIQYVGETLRYLLAAPKPDPPSLDRNHRVHLAWGNGLRPDVWDEFKDRFGIKSIAEMYSATEGTFGLFNLSNNDFSKGAIGRNGWIYNALMGRSIAIVAVDWATDEPLRDPSNKNLCKRVTPGEPGEMLFRLPDDPALLKKRFQGYFNNPGATNKKILRDVLAKGDHWFRTGDVVRWGADGLVYFHDRIGDTFRWKAENVSTAEVSQTLGAHPAVSEANVYGVQLPRHDGRAGCAAVHLTPSAQPASQETFRSIAEHVRASLPRYAVPLFLRVLDGDVGQQSTGTYKQQKNVLRDLGVDPGAGGPGTLYWLRDDGYVPFQQADYKDIEGGSVKL